METLNTKQKLIDLVPTKEVFEFIIMNCYSLDNFRKTYYTLQETPFILYGSGGEELKYTFDSLCNDFKDKLNGAINEYLLNTSNDFSLGNSIVLDILRYAITSCRIFNLSTCYFSNITFDRRTISYDNLRISENEVLQAIREHIDATEWVYIQSIDAYSHVDECIEVIDGEDEETILQPQFLNTYEYNDNLYTYRGIGNNNLVFFEGNVYHIDDCVECEDTSNLVPVDYTHYHSGNDCYYQHQDSIEQLNGLVGYHNSNFKNKSNDATYCIGFEVEKEDDYFSDFSTIRANGWDAERDGSLNDNGFELVSPIYNLNDMGEFKNDMQKIGDFINADCSSNCGGHINISVKGKDAKEIFALIQGYTPLIYAMFPTRLNNRYCEAKKLVDMSNRQRYEAINFTKGNVLEFRIFSRVKNVNQLAWRYRFIQYLFNNQRKGSASIVRMLLTDSKLKSMLLEVYPLDSFNKLVDRVIEYTDIYMSSRDAKTTATMILKMKEGGIKLAQLQPQLIIQ